MGAIDEIKKMRQEGKSESNIRADLRKRGVPDGEINEALSQSAIKDAVDGRAGLGADEEMTFADAPSPVEYSAPAPSQGRQQGYENMQPSMVSEMPSGEANEPGQQTAQQDYSASGYGGEQYSAYPQYQPYQETVSSDIITEISEQVVNERLAFLQDKMEKALEFRNIAEARISSLNERLQRIEKILDRLQLSILQRVGEYVADVKDIKKELSEDRKSFKVLHRKGRKHHKK